MDRDNGAVTGERDDQWSCSDGRSGGTTRASRGQTTLDFAIGISVFLAVVMFIFLFAPGILDPFTTGTQEETTTANRVVEEVGQNLLSSPARPFVLDGECTVEFFEGTEPPPADCNYHPDPGASPANVTDHLGLGPQQNVNVTITGNVTADRGSEVLCWDDAGVLIERDGDGPADDSCDHGGSDVLLARGDAPPQDNDATVTAARVGSLERQDVTIVVVVW